MSRSSKQKAALYSQKYRAKKKIEDPLFLPSEATRLANLRNDAKKDKRDAQQPYRSSRS